MIDWQAYLANNHDVAAAGVDPAQHYAQYGQAEGRQVAEIPQVSDQQITDWWGQHQGDANLAQEAQQAMQQYGLDQGRVQQLTGYNFEPKATIPREPQGINTLAPNAATISRASNGVFTDEEINQLYIANNGDPAAVNRALAAQMSPGPSYYGGGDSYDPYDPIGVADGIRRAYEQRRHTANNFMSREDFIKKYGTTFVADDKGGNAASEVAGQDVAAYYDTNLGPGATGDSSGFGWKYRDAHPYFDAWDNVNPHPESQDLGGVGEFWRQLGRPIATAAAMYYGVSALGSMTGGAAATGAGTAATGTGGAAGIGSGTALGGATGVAAAPTASGVAGVLGMDAGVGATMVNSAALSTGRSLATGHNIGDALTSGVKGAATGWLGTELGDVIGTVGDGAISASQANILGDAGANLVINGKDAALNSLVMGEVGAGVDTLSKSMGLDKLPASARQAAIVTMGSVLQGKDPSQAIVNIAVGAGMKAALGDSLSSVPGYSALSDKGKQAVLMVAVDVMRGKNPGGAAFDLAMAEANAEIKRQKSTVPDFLTRNEAFDPEGPYGLPQSFFDKKRAAAEKQVPFTAEQFEYPDQVMLDPVEIAGAKEDPPELPLDQVTVSGKREWPDEDYSQPPRATPPAPRATPPATPAPRTAPSTGGTGSAPAAAGGSGGTQYSVISPFKPEGDFGARRMRVNAAGQMTEDDDNNKLTPEVTVASVDETKENGPELSALGVPSVASMAALLGIT